MDVSALLAIVVLIIALIVPVFLLFRTQSAEARKAAAAEAAVKAREDAALAKKQAKLERGVGKKKKGGLARMKKGGDFGLEEETGAGMASAVRDDDDDDDDDGDGPSSRRDQRKADKKAEHREQVEARQAQREANREREEERDAKRRAKDAEREARAQAREEEERLKAEAIAKAKQEEYDAWKDMFSVDEAGEEAGAAVEEEGQLERFIDHMKAQKVNVLEGLAAEFGLKVQDVVERVQALEQMGHISGVIDDRGKFIYITRDEMQAVAKYINRKGRVRISTLAQESNRLIDLTPKKTDIPEGDADADADGSAAAA